METEKESPRFILILGSLFLIAYATYNLGIAWMDSLPENAKSLTVSQEQAPSSSNLPPALDPTNVPLRWITPTSTGNDAYPAIQTTSYPDSAASLAKSDDTYPLPTSADALPTETYPAPSVEPTDNPTVTSTTEISVGISA